MTHTHTERLRGACLSVKVGRLCCRYSSDPTLTLSFEMCGSRAHRSQHLYQLMNLIQHQHNQQLYPKSTPTPTNTKNDHPTPNKLPPNANPPSPFSGAHQRRDASRAPQPESGLSEARRCLQLRAGGLPCPLVNPSGRLLPGGFETSPDQIANIILFF